VIDYHVHLWPHTEVAGDLADLKARIEGQVDAARAADIAEVALTEHLFRFRQVYDIVGEFWTMGEDPIEAASMAEYFAHHATVDLDAYIEEVTRLRDSGAPVKLGLEVDFYPGQMDAVRTMLEAYPFDVVLGSIHWLDLWRFDDLDDQAAMARWETDDVDAVWRHYTDAIVELCASRAIDVLAHIDVAKVTGHRPGPAVLEECYERIVAATREAGVAVEVSSAGLRKPAAELYPAPSLLQRLVHSGIALTAASDAHEPETVGYRFAEVEAALEAVGVGSLRSFRARRPIDVPVRRQRPIRGPAT
jgi:histidinol-phosphatase (PHP family)